MVNPVIPVLERRAKYGETMTEPQIIDDIASWFYVDADKAFQDAIKEGLIVKDGKNCVDQDLWVLVNCSVKRLVRDKAAGDAHVKKVMADADAYVEKRVAERMRSGSWPPAKTGHGAEF